MWMLNKLPTREERVAGAYVGASMKSHFLSYFSYLTTSFYQLVVVLRCFIESGVVSGLKM